MNLTPEIADEFLLQLQWLLRLVNVPCNVINVLLNHHGFCCFDMCVP